MFKKLKEKIEFLKWAYEHRYLQDPFRNVSFTTQTIKPELIVVRRSFTVMDYENNPAVCERMVDGDIAKSISKRCKIEIEQGPYEDVIFLKKEFYFKPVEKPNENIDNGA